jgi:hypothetical protein
MRRLCVIFALLASFSSAFAGDGNRRAETNPLPPTGRVVKVLPLFLDLQGRDSTSPSLFDRDAYQFYLRQHTNEISAIRFDVLWKTLNIGPSKLKLRLELRGIGAGGVPTQMVLEHAVAPKLFHQWASLTLGGVDYKNFGELIAWRATLWDDDKMLGEQKSFLW